MPVKLIISLFVVFFSIPLNSNAAEAKNKNVVRLGMSTALSGPNQYLGKAIYDGMIARFNEVNDSGGIKGKKIQLTVLDDGYQPENAFHNTKLLIDKHKVVAIVGNVGTPTASRSAPEANKNKVVFYGAYTGANILRRSPPEPYIFNYRASYEQEMQVIIDNILDSNISPHKIAFFLQDDKYGQAGYEAAVSALNSSGFKYSDKLPKTYYQRNSLSIQEAIISLIKTNPEPEAVIIVGSYKASAKLISFLHKLFYRTKFYNLSFAGAPALANLLSNIEGRVYITQVVPPITEEFARKHNIQYGNDVTRLEGYLAANIFVDVLKSIKGDITSEKIRQALEAKGNFNMGLHNNLSFSKNDHQASDQVWLSELKRGGKWEIINN